MKDGMNKLWSFGCSWTLGAELGSNVNLVEFLIKHTGCKSIKEARNKLGDNNFVKEIIPKWLDLIGYHQNDPSSSYAGVLSKKFELELVCCAVGGTGIDRAFFEIINNSKKINWDKDLVILGVPPPGRWIAQSMPGGNNFRFFGLSSKLHRQLDPYLPSIESMDMFHYSTLLSIKRLFPKVNIIRMYDNRNSACINDTRLDPDNIYIGSPALSFENFCRSNSNNGNWQYPNAHPTEEFHEKFAEELLPYFNKINRRRLKA